MPFTDSLRARGGDPTSGPGPRKTTITPCAASVARRTRMERHAQGLDDQQRADHIRQLLSGKKPWPNEHQL